MNDEKYQVTSWGQGMKILRETITLTRNVIYNKGVA
jgi:hypothetical protein